jgi:RecQ family ATP-dependent DNA helicase
VRDDIIESLGLRDVEVVVRGLDRPNIRLRVRRCTDDHEKRAVLVEHVVGAAKPGIVYAATRRSTEELSELLRAEGVGAAAYHAGMSHRAREDVQHSFMEGELEVVVATTAFGLGIDKADVRFVDHFDVAESLDAYYQEIGRAGRDGDAAEALLVYRTEDLGIRRYFASREDDRQEELERSRVEMMQSYAERRDCRRQLLLTYLGEPLEEPCGNCDNCLARTVTDRDADVPTTERPFPVDAPVRHDAFGAGRVVGYDRDLVLVVFDDHGYKHLDLGTVVDRQLLRLADAPGA